MGAFLKQLAKRAKRLRGTGIDMSASYSSAINKHLPGVAVVYDRFHVTKLLNDTIDKIRRSESTKHRGVVNLIAQVRIFGKRRGRSRCYVNELQGDRGYDSQELRNKLRSKGIRPLLAKRVWHTRKQSKGRKAPQNERSF